MNNFKFKKFEIAHDQCAFKVGTDSILLGSWILGEFETILDIGCGSGILALMCAQKFSQARVLGVEIDSESAKQAQQNVLRSPWPDRVEVRIEDVKNLKSDSFDLIISNPPYFPFHLQSPNQRKNTARQESVLSLQDFLKASKALSHSNSTLAIVYPFERFKELKECARAEGWYLRKELRLISKPVKAVERILAQFERHERLLASKTLCIANQAGEYSPEFQELTKKFYLNF